jgi:ketosteroid isomerase-like protein
MHPMRIMTLILTLALAGTSQANDSPEALQDAFMAGILAQDADAIAACYADDAVNFTLDSMMGIGPDSARRSWGGFFEGFDVQSAELSETHLEVHGDTAIAWGLFLIVAVPRAGGEPVEFRGRYMDVARNINGRWLYVADHASMPLPAPE